MISVMIASMGRASLVDTLKSVASAHVPEGESVEIVIADDSAGGLVAQTIAGLELGVPVRVLPVGRQNVSEARNACLDAASGEWLIFVDDDEEVEPGWLEGHLSAARDFAADVVLGPVYPRYPAGMPAWFLSANPLFQNWKWEEDGRTIAHGRTGNTLIRRSSLGSLRFDPAFGRSGGEDHDFFLRLAAGGARMVVTNRARVHEHVPPDRAAPAYALRRSMRTGQIYARLHLRGRGSIFVFRFTIGALAKLVIAMLAGLILRLFDRAKAFRFLMRASTNLGKLREIFGRRLMTAWENGHG